MVFLYRELTNLRRNHFHQRVNRTVHPRICFWKDMLGRNQASDLVNSSVHPVKPPLGGLRVYSLENICPVSWQVWATGFFSKDMGRDSIYHTHTAGIGAIRCRRQPSVKPEFSASHREDTSPQRGSPQATVGPILGQCHWLNSKPKPYNH